MHAGAHCTAALWGWLAREKCTPSRIYLCKDTMLLLHMYIVWKVQSVACLTGVA